MIPGMGAMVDWERGNDIGKDLQCNITNILYTVINYVLVLCKNIENSERWNFCRPSFFFKFLFCSSLSLLQRVSGMQNFIMLHRVGKKRLEVLSPSMSPAITSSRTHISPRHSIVGSFRPQSCLRECLPQGPEVNHLGAQLSPRRSCFDHLWRIFTPRFRFDSSCGVCANDGL